MSMEELIAFADSYSAEFIQGMCFEAQMSLPSNLMDNIKAGTVKTKADVKAYCDWYVKKYNPKNK